MDDLSSCTVMVVKGTCRYREAALAYCESSTLHMPRYKEIDLGCWGMAKVPKSRCTLQVLYRYPFPSCKKEMLDVASHSSHCKKDGCGDQWSLMALSEGLVHCL